MTQERTAIVFIDGNNLYHNLREMRIKPGHIDFHRMGELVCSYFKCKRTKTIYYNSVPSIRDGQQMYYDHMKYLSELEKLPNFMVKTRKLQRHSTRELLDEKTRAISGLGLCGKCKPLVEANCSDCIGNIKKKEKGIDIMIAVDMLNLSIIEKTCDCSILLSGDADFIPACEIIQNKGGKVYSASVTRGYSYELRDKLEFFILDKDILISKCLKEGKDGIMW